MRSIISTLLFTPAALAVSGNTETARLRSSRYDYIVVGGGTSGLVVANRLSEDYNVSVAVIEAGGVELYDTNITDTSKYGNAFGTAVDWQYESVPQSYAGRAAQVLRAGKALGGTSNINGMTYLRAEAVQIDAWEEIGNPGWSWEKLLPYYKKSEYIQQPTKSQLARGASLDIEVHGSAGPLAVGWTGDMMGEEVISSINDTFAALNLPFNKEPNAGSMRGLTVFPKTIEQVDNVREDAGRAYYWPVANRPNLHLYLEAFAERIIWHPEMGLRDRNRTASGVVFVDRNGSQRTLLANREVILSAGSLRSPLLLEQSGIGNPSILQKHDIDVVVDLPFVGENMQDQTTTDMFYTSNNSTNFTGLAGYAAYFNADDVFGNDTSTLNTTILNSISHYAAVTANASGTLDRSVTERLFRLQHDLIFKHKIPISEIIISPAATGPITIEYWGLLPFSRGSIHINSSNASAPATIDPRYFMLNYDIHQQIATAKMARRFANTVPFSAALESETTPGLNAVPADASDGEWEAWLKATYRSNFHYIATAAMMPRELGGVVDSNLIVYGTSNIRVVDASVVPFQVCGHLTSTLYAIAEKAADMIKARYT
ncbi:glucose oxidase [Boeremia exigua]|uniref:glucose oxidase n=1 Tax=Boeremia exigua TaxID=749465 RepID=UPI001E8E8A47|nr:glucose oxidase [Boeremia exigua]KAH6643240.1 glucose oxidase [Boeremia exigua]